MYEFLPEHTSIADCSVNEDAKFQYIHFYGFFNTFLLVLLYMSFEHMIGNFNGTVSSMNQANM